MYTPEQQERRARMWNTWARTPEDAHGWCTHVFEQGTERAAAGRAICGAPSHDGGLRNMHLDDYEPGCLRCRKALRKAGLMP
jgi:hypothetical protein